jgi:hypothetical protein
MGADPEAHDLLIIQLAERPMAKSLSYRGNAIALIGHFEV